MADYIALLFVYMPIIREEIYSFADLWNAHVIRKQDKRPNVVPGKPVVLYFNPQAGVRDYGSPVPSDRLQQLRQSVQEYGR
jgi:hypothetical protein